MSFISRLSTMTHKKSGNNKPKSKNIIEKYQERSIINRWKE